MSVIHHKSYVNVPSLTCEPRTNRSMRMARHSLAKIPILYGEIEACSGVELSDMSAVQLLPWRIMPQLRRRSFRLPPRDLLVADQQFDTPVAKVNQHFVVVPHDGQV